MDPLHSTQRCLAAIADAAGEGARTFTQVHADQALLEAGRAASRRARGEILSPLDGLVVSVKDLFDVAGHETWAGSRVLQGSAPAASDAPVISRLRAAGCIIVGKTNMTEFAYSGLGLNPHFGTPANPYGRDRGRRISGGSSSGAAVALTDGMAEISIGTDTGGSVRIPAAFCGLVGWKPTARRIPLQGVYPLSPNFDSVGVLAHSVARCIDADLMLAEALPAMAPRSAPLRLARLRGYVETGLDAAVTRAYEAALQRIAGTGARVEDLHIPALETIPTQQPGATLQTYEAFRVHASRLEQDGDRYDPRVRQRLELGRGISAEAYAEARATRQSLQRIVAEAVDGFDALLLPTVAIAAPLIAEFETDERYFALNRQILRNTALLNFLDGCAISLPCHEAGGLPVGLSIAGTGGADARVLEIARLLEATVAPRTDGH